MLPVFFLRNSYNSCIFGTKTVCPPCVCICMLHLQFWRLAFFKCQVARLTPGADYFINAQYPQIKYYLSWGTGKPDSVSSWLNQEQNASDRKGLWVHYELFLWWKKTHSLCYRLMKIAKDFLSDYAIFSFCFLWWRKKPEIHLLHFLYTRRQTTFVRNGISFIHFYFYFATK